MVDKIRYSISFIAFCFNMLWAIFFTTTYNRRGLTSCILDAINMQVTPIQCNYLRAKLCLCSLVNLSMILTARKKVSASQQKENVTSTIQSIIFALNYLLISCDFIGFGVTECTSYRLIDSGMASCRVLNKEVSGGFADPLIFVVILKFC